MKRNHESCVGNLHVHVLVRRVQDISAHCLPKLSSKVKVEKLKSVQQQQCLPFAVKLANELKEQTPFSRVNTAIFLSLLGEVKL